MRGESATFLRLSLLLSILTVAIFGALAQPNTVSSLQVSYSPSYSSSFKLQTQTFSLMFFYQQPTRCSLAGCSSGMCCPSNAFGNLSCASSGTSVACCVEYNSVNAPTKFWQCDGDRECPTFAQSQVSVTHIYIYITFGTEVMKVTEKFSFTIVSTTIGVKRN